jgi:hypothetical protein
MDLTVRDVEEIQEQRNRRREVIYTAQLERCLDAIRRAMYLIHDVDYIMTTVPFSISGEPLYQPYECARFLKRSLEGRGFGCDILKPGNRLFVTWDAKIQKTEVVVEYDPNDPKAAEKIQRALRTQRRTK